MNSTDDINSFFGSVVYSYTRAQAVTDGVLVRLPKLLAMRAGFRITDIVVTSRVWAAVVNGYPSLLLSSLLQAIKESGNTDRVYFSTHGHELYAVIGPGDDGEPVITIMFTDED